MFRLSFPKIILRHRFLALILGKVRIGCHLDIIDFKHDYFLKLLKIFVTYQERSNIN